MHEKTLDDGIKKLMMMFPDKVIVPNLWEELLIGISDEDFKIAVSHICLNCTEVNKSTNLIALIVKNVGDKGKTNANDAWDEVLSEIKRVGWCDTPKFSNRLIERAISLNGGWQHLCQSTQINWDKKNFQTTLKELQEKDFTEDSFVKIEDSRMDNLVKQIK